MTGFFDLEHLIHSIKTVIACTIGLLLVRFIGLPGDQWVVITIIVVMCAQIYVGSVMQKAYLRLLGTLVGCLFATFTLLFLGSSPLSIAIAIGLSSFIFSYLATKYENYTYAGTLGAVTTTIIMLGQPQPTLLIALERFLEISLGVLIATLVSQFILPIHARTHLRTAQATTLRQLHDYFKKTMVIGSDASADYQEADEHIVKSLLIQRQLAKESIREKFGLAFSNEHFMESLYFEREILRAMTFMHQAILHAHEIKTLFIESKAGKIFNNQTLASLSNLINLIEKDEPPKTPIILPLIQPFMDEINASQTHLSDLHRVYLNGFLFCAEILSNGLARLAILYQAPIANLDKINQNLSI